MEAMSKKEKLARGSAVIKVMKVIPRPGRYLNKYIEVHKLPRKPKPPTAAKGLLAEMPWLNVKVASFDVFPMSARIEPPYPFADGKEKKDSSDPCAVEDEEDETEKKGLPDGHKMLKYFGYREWIKATCPAYDGNLAEHFNIMLGLLMSMAKDPENEEFPDAEAYPCVQFLKTIKTPEGEIPHNTASFVSYIEYVCQKMIDEG